MSRKKSKGRIDAAVDDLAGSAADHIVPLIHSAADAVESAADRVGPLAQAAADRVGPLAQAAAGKVEPLAHTAAGKVSDTVSPYAQQAIDLLEPYAHSAADKVAPYAKSARKHGAQAAHDAVEKIGPRLDDALERVSPAVENARDRLQKDWLPKLADRLSDAAETVASTPAGIETQKRSRAAAAALRGELVLPEDAPVRKKVLPKIGLLFVLGGLVFFVVRKLLAPNESDWQAAKPAPYASTTITEPARPGDAGGASSAVTAPGSTDKGPAASVVADHSSVFEVSPDAADVATGDDHDDEPAPAHAADESDESHDSHEGGSPDRSQYGEHAFIGAEPPEGFTIKANERSKKFHLPESAGYSRTNTEVWFDSEEAAEAAGFTKAQR